MKQKVETLNVEVDWDKTSELVTRTSRTGIINYANSAFITASGYSKDELLDQPHNITRHPDMPRAIFRLLWESLKIGEDFHAIIKNKTKEGKFYWFITQFNFIRDGEGNISEYMARRKSVSDEAITKIEKVYKTLKEIEEEKGLDKSLSYFENLLNEKNQSYEEFLSAILTSSSNDDEKKNKKANQVEDKGEKKSIKSFWDSLFVIPRFTP